MSVADGLQRRPSRVGQRAAIGHGYGMQCNHPAQTDSQAVLDRHVALERRPRHAVVPLVGGVDVQEAAPEPGGSACCHWNGYGTQCGHPAQQGRRPVRAASEVCVQKVDLVGVEAAVGDRLQNRAVLAHSCSSFSPSGFSIGIGSCRPRSPCRGRRTLQRTCRSHPGRARWVSAMLLKRVTPPGPRSRRIPLHL